MNSHDHLQKNQKSIQNWLKTKCVENSSWEEVLTECDDVSEGVYQDYMTL